MPMDANRLKAIPIFSELSEEESRRLSTFVTEQSIAEGQILMKQGDYSVELIAIEEGSADVIRDGEKIAALGKGDLIGEMGLFDRRPRNADVIATSPMRALKLTHWEIRRMSRRHDRADQARDRGAPEGRRGRSGGPARARLRRAPPSRLGYAVRAGTAPSSAHAVGIF